MIANKTVINPIAKGEAIVTSDQFLSPEDHGNTKTTLVIGGCRSGKSRYALDMANRISGSRKLFIATSVPTDSEMEERVRTHQKDRGEDWITAEIPVDIPQKIKDASKSSDVILVDCLTLWVSNLLFNDFTHDAVIDITDKLENALNQSSCPVILVSNEVGSGIVPENRLARLFRDTAGFVNQKAAAAADNVFLMAAGIPVKIKG